MIEVDIKLNRFGLQREENFTRLGRIQIINDGTGNSMRANYDVRVFDKSGNRVIRNARVENWPRSAKTATQLLAAALEAAYAE